MISIDALLARTRQEGTCRIWTGSINKRTGYGSVWANGRTRQVHVVAFELHYGPVPPGKCVMHTCDVRPCIDGAHLVTGTRQDNMDDMNAKGRGRKATRGHGHAAAKLTADQVAAIRQRYRPYDRRNSSCALAREFGVHQSTVYALLAEK
jgi:hypothetical protein